MKGKIYLSEFIAVKKTKRMGLGVLALANLPAGLLLETSPVIVMSAQERTLLDQTALHDYIFIWGEKEDQCAMALGYVSMYNHSFEPNCEYEMDYESGNMTVRTIKAVKKGEELFFSYNGDPNDKSPLWFETT